MTTWLIVGASPGAPRYIDGALKHAGFLEESPTEKWDDGGTVLLWTGKPYTFAVANAGILLLNERNIRPDWFGVLEGETPAKWYSKAPPGTPAVTTRHVYRLFQKLAKEKDPRNLVMPEPCLVLEDTKPGQAATWKTDSPWERGKVWNCGATGGFLLQFAVNSGATEVHVVGCEGYRSSSQVQCVDTFDGEMGVPSGESMTLSLYGPTMQAIVKAESHRVRFVFYGSMSYDVEKCGAEVVQEVAV